MRHETRKPVGATQLLQAGDDDKTVDHFTEQRQDACFVPALAIVDVPASS